MHAMPAHIPALHAIGMKWVAGYPGNARRGLPQITGILVLNDEDTGLPLAVMDCAWITAKRTGGATAVAARYLARTESEVVGVLGCGVQGRANLEALTVILPLKQAILYDAQPEAAERLAREVPDRWGLTAAVATDPRQAVEGCDVVVTAGPSPRVPHATIRAGWLDAGAFASLVDWDAYWDRAALNEADKFITDDVDQLDYYRGKGYFQGIPPIYATLGELVGGKKPGRETVRERTIACNLGVALADIATAALIYERALARSIGTWLPL